MEAACHPLSPNPLPPKSKCPGARILKNQINGAVLFLQTGRQPFSWHELLTGGKQLKTCWRKRTLTLQETLESMKNKSNMQFSQS